MYAHESPFGDDAGAVDIARSHGLGPPPMQGRESHTADLGRFDVRVEEVRAFERAATDPPFHQGLWSFLRDILAPCETSVGYPSEADASVSVPKAPTDVQRLGARVGQLALVNPINPSVLAAGSGVPLELVLAELFVATRVGMVRMRWSPECVRCGSAVSILDALGELPPEADCAGCGMPNRMHSLDKVMVTFTFAPDVLYVLANNYACTPSQRSMGYNAAFAPMAATNTGSGFRYSLGTGAGQVAEALPAGRYRMHCPVSMTDNFLEVQRDAGPDDAPLEVAYAISEMVVTSGSEERKTVTVEHGRVHFDIFPDTRSFFVLWIQEDVEEELLMHLPPEERAPFTSAAVAMTHPMFRFFRGQLVPGGGSRLDVSDVFLVFTDIVGSTDLYAELGDGNALGVVHDCFRALFGAFTARGRIVKTIGDSVMAAFPTGTAALEAAADGLEAVSRGCRNPVTGDAIQIRVGVHRGSALVVPVNGINDYFGQTVNVAARIEGEAGPSHCLVSSNVLADPDAQAAFDALVRAGRFSSGGSRVFQPRGVDRSVTVHDLALVG